MNLSKIFFICMVFFTILAIFSVNVGLDTKEGKPVPCVDGKNRVNLEGIMCENKYNTYFGVSEYYIFLWLIPVALFEILTFKYQKPRWRL